MIISSIPSYKSLFLNQLSAQIINSTANPIKNQGIWIEYVEGIYFYDKNDPSKVYFPENLFDNLEDTAWVTESKISYPTIKIYFHIPVNISKLSIKNGLNDEQTDQYKDNGRVKTFQIRTKYKNFDFTLNDTSQWQSMALPDISVDYIELVVTSYYPGRKWFTICLSEISFNLPSEFSIKEMTARGQSLYAWMIKNLTGKTEYDSTLFSKIASDYLKQVVTSIGIPGEENSSLREQAFPYFAFINNTRKIPLSLGFPRDQKIIDIYESAFNSDFYIKSGVFDAYSPTYFFSLYANSLQPYASMLAKSMLLNLSFDSTIATDKALEETLLHFLVLGMDLRSNYYRNKYKVINTNQLPTSVRIQFTFYRLLRSIRNSPYKPLAFYETVMLEDCIELPSYINYLLEYINNKDTFEQEYLEGGKIEATTFQNDPFIVANIDNIAEFGKFAISMYLHNEDLINYFKFYISGLNLSDETKSQLIKILIDSNYYAKHPERQYY
jgi:hypothetical protein